MVAPGQLYRVVEGAGTMLARNRDRESLFLGALVAVAAVTYVATVKSGAGGATDAAVNALEVDKT
jgi:hypothetical protein